MMVTRAKGKFVGVAVIAIVCFLSAESTYALDRQKLVNAITALTSKITALETQTSLLVSDNNVLLNKLASTNLDKSSLLTVGISTNVVAGSQVQVPIKFVLGPIPIAGVQADIVIPSSFSVVGIVAGPAATLAGKSVSMNVLGQTTRIIIFGLNQTPIFSGVVATLTLKSASVAPKGINPIVSLSPSATDANGNTVLLTTTSGLVTIK